MFEKEQRVMLINKKRFVSYGKIEDICYKSEELKKYFSKEHPKYFKFKMAILNKNPIYIINLEKDMGQAGVLIDEIKKISS